MEENPTQNLIMAAVAAAEHAYIPYSRYAVGAALRTTTGRVFRGCNVENASYPAGLCAERVALVKAVSEGERSFDLLVVATRNGGAPCGICRQMLYEFAPSLHVVIVDFTGKVDWQGPLSDLLPRGFGPVELEA